MDFLKPLFLHLVAIVVALAVAVGVIALFGVESQLGVAGIALAALLLEKLGRLLLKDWVNE